MKSITIKEAQEKVHQMIVTLAGRDDSSIYWSPHECLARLSEEVGELAREINAEHGRKKKQNPEETNIVSEELADVLQAVLIMANALNVDIEEEFLKKVEVIKTRDSKRFKR